MKCGFEFGEHVEIGVGAGKFVGGESKCLSRRLNRRFGFEDAPLPLGRAVIFTSTGIVSVLEISAAMAASAFLCDSAEN